GMDLANYLDALSVGIVHDEPVTRSPDVARWKEQLNRENVEHSVLTDSDADTTGREWLTTQFEALIDIVQALHSAISRVHEETERSREGTSEEETSDSEHQRTAVITNK
ncbi:MAG TPA: hypothetical protein VHS80_11940, partial [Chthoniobacterales bacterium]|nr:hypothetical protein [Chthoniobacterales bacterium]